MLNLPSSLCCAVGCCMGELLKHAPLFPGKTEIAMLDMFTKLLGNPHIGIWPVCITPVLTDPPP